MSISTLGRVPAAMAASAVLFSVSSRADDPFDHIRPGFELNVPSLATIYGRLAMGYLKLPDEPCQAATCNDPNKPNRGSRTRSYLGFRATETLSGGLAAHFLLERSLFPGYGTASGDPVDSNKPWEVPAGPSFSGGSVVGLSSRSWGRVDLGRRDQPAWKVALAADPWADSSVASPGSRLYLPATEGATRSPNSLTYSSPTGHPWGFELQRGRDRSEQRTELGGSLRYASGAWFAAIGWQRWSDDAYAVPLALTWDAGSFKAYAGITRGRNPSAADYTSLFAGATMPLMSKGDPLRTEWRFGLATYNPSAGPGDVKFGAGWRYRFSPRTFVRVDAALVRNDDGKRSHGVEVGFVHSFERNLHTPAAREAPRFPRDPRNVGDQNAPRESRDLGDPL